MWLYERVANALNDDENETKIPPYITQNLSKELREYQQNALKHFLRQRKFRNDKTNHLLFNMATGSGKTLMMAALMLECFKLGYRNFVFFVNSKAVLEKTKENFANSQSDKYLFANRIEINGENIEINIINNLDDSKEHCINILFTTIQSIFNMFKDPREGSLTIDELENKELVFLADEAHHLNADTKKLSKNEQEQEQKEGWESVVMKAFSKNNNNLMLEFTATLPKFKEVENKYKNKVIYKYDLAEFVKNGYAKKIFLIKYNENNNDLKARFLGSCILSLYRELLADNESIKTDFPFKPIILFKSETITNSQNNKQEFIKLIENLNEVDIKEFFNNIASSKCEIFTQSYDFFKEKWQGEIYTQIAKFLKEKFKQEFIINTNDEKELDKNQLLLNSLESKNNEKRVIFSVDKLNEGWDVLNLFDIVRLNNKTKNTAVTTREAQLIGRGARYFPFILDDDEKKFKRKFDNDLKNPFSNLEKLTYHAINDAKFIDELNKAIKEQGLLIDNNETKVKLEANEALFNNFKEQKIEKIDYIKFNKIVIDENSLFEQNKERIREKIKRLEIPYFSSEISQKELLKDNEKDEKVFHKNIQLKDKIENIFFYKAMNSLNISFKNLTKFKAESKKDFIENYLQEIYVNFDKRQEFNTKTKLQIAKYIVENLKNEMQTLIKQYKIGAQVSNFDIDKFKDLEVITTKILDDNNYLKNLEFEWFYHKNALIDSGLELEFLKFIEAKKDLISKKFKNWFIIRNSSFSEFKIYDYRKEILDNGERVENPTYADGFEPDFIFFGKRKGDDFYTLECFMESKGEHLASGQDKWKEQLLNLLSDDFKNKKEIFIDINKEKFEILGLPFFKENILEFESSFNEFINNNTIK